MFKYNVTRSSFTSRISKTATGAEKRHETLNKETQEGQKQVGEIEALCYLMCFCYDERSEC